MTEVRVGDVRRDDCGVYVITKEYIDNGNRMFEAIEPSGWVYKSIAEGCVENDEFLSHYNTWIEAIASKEFNQ